MRFLFRQYLLAALAAVFLSASPVMAEELDPAAEKPLPLLDPVAGYERLASLPATELDAIKAQLLAFEIDLPASPGFSVEAVGARVEVRYRMAFNSIAEGWSWQPLADPQKEDYYRAKFLPLKSVLLERGEYDQQDKIGETQRMKVSWRYDYFLAFDNLYDFYPRGIDDDAGFVASLPALKAGQANVPLRMLAVIRLTAPFVSESTTFWKATHAKPTDFTLKKRYLIGQLLEVWFCNSASGEVLAKIRPRAQLQEAPRTDSLPTQR